MAKTSHSRNLAVIVNVFSPLILCCYPLGLGLVWGTGGRQGGKKKVITNIWVRQAGKVQNAALNEQMRLCKPLTANCGV